MTTNTMLSAQVTSDAKGAIAIYNTHPEDETAVNSSGQASTLRDYQWLADYHTDEQVVGYYNAGDRMKHWGKLGALWGLLFGAAFFWVPELGPLLVAGPLAASIVADETRVWLAR